MKNDAFGCRDRDDTEKVASLAAQGDSTAALNAIMTGIGNGTCVDFSKDDEVYVETVSVWHGDTQIHRRGSPDDYWVYTEKVSVTPQ